MITCRTCGFEWGGLKMEHCVVENCHLTFSTTSVGDAHRVGLHGVKEGPDRRRCLSAEEFADLRNKKGEPRFKLNKRGVWVGAGSFDHTPTEVAAIDQDLTLLRY